MTSPALPGPDGDAPGRTQAYDLRFVRLTQHGNRLLDGPARTGQALLVDREFGSTGIDRITESLDREIGEFLGNQLEPSPDVIEFTCHTPFIAHGCDADPFRKVDRWNRVGPGRMNGTE